MKTHFPPTQLMPWLTALRAGQVAAAPAEGVYGYCADPFNPTALQSLITLKQRNPAKGFILLVSNPYQLASVATLAYPQNPTLHAALTKAVTEHCHFAPPLSNPDHSPPTTLILPAAANVDAALTGANTAHGFPTVAVRAPTCAYMLEYLKAFGGPLVSTSLNLSGQPPATQASQIPIGIPALTLPHALSGQPSRIFNPLTDQWLR